MAGGLKVEDLKVSGSGTVGAPSDPLAALRWKASSSPAVKEIDGKLAELFKRRTAEEAAYQTERTTLDTQREAALKAAMRELVG